MLRFKSTAVHPLFPCVFNSADLKSENEEQVCAWIGHSLVLQWPKNKQTKNNPPHFTL
ncbi:hypothetical protein E2320_020652 [Naja naja]|nr:hypothetical protein E2320_020652 [Naja naja]